MYKPTTRRFLFAFLLFLSAGAGFSQNAGAYKCLDFDGTNDYVLIKDHASLNSDSTITVEAWIKADNYGRNVFDNSIFCKHGWSRGNLGYVCDVVLAESCLLTSLMSTEPGERCQPLL